MILLAQKRQAAESEDLGHAVVAVLARHNLDLLVRILDPADAEAVGIEGRCAVIAADDLHLDGHAFKVGYLGVNHEEVTALLVAGVAGRRVVTDILQRTTDAGSSHRHIALEIRRNLAEQIFISRDVDVNGESV